MAELGYVSCAIGGGPPSLACMTRPSDRVQTATFKSKRAEVVYTRLCVILVVRVPSVRSHCVASLTPDARGGPTFLVYYAPAVLQSLAPENGVVGSQQRQTHGGGSA